jgi:hypothetical protein
MPFEGFAMIGYGGHQDAYSLRIALLLVQPAIRRCDRPVSVAVLRASMDSARRFFLERHPYANLKVMDRVEEIEAAMNDLPPEDFRRIITLVS